MIKKQYTVKKMAGNRWFYTFTKPNAKYEKMIVEISSCTTPKCKNSLPYLWKKEGYLKRVLKTFLSVQTCVTEPEGNCYIGYNPYLKTVNTINFEWMLEDTEENKEKLINEIIRLFYE